MAQRPAPINVQYPAIDHYNLPTGGQASPPNFRARGLANAYVELDQLLQRAPTFDADLVKLTVPDADNSCYRDVALTLLLSLRPFLGFLEYTYNHEPTGTSLPKILRLLGLALRQNDSKNLEVNMNTLMYQLARLQDAERVSHGEDGKKNPSSNGDDNGLEQEDAGVYLLDILQKLNEHSMLYAGTPPEYLLPRILINDLNERLVLSCGCQQEKSRRGYQMTSSRGPMIPVNIEPGVTSLDIALSRQVLYERRPTLRTCETCNEQQDEIVFRKFRHLPEVLLIEVNYIDPTTNMPDTNRGCSIPEVLDLSNVLDKEYFDEDNKIVADDMRNCEYTLHGVVAYQAGNWKTFDSRQRGARKVQDTTLRSIMQDEQFQPRIVAYVRTFEKQTDQQNEASASESIKSVKPAAHQAQVPNPPDKLSTSIIDKLDMKTAKNLHKKYGIVMPLRKDLQSLKDSLRTYVCNPYNYNLFTVQKLKSLMEERDIASRKKLTKKADIVKALNIASKKAISFDSPSAGHAITHPSASPGQTNKSQRHSHRTVSRDSPDNAPRKAIDPITVSVPRIEHDNLKNENEKLRKLLKKSQQNEQNFLQIINNMKTPSTLIESDVHDKLKADLDNAKQTVSIQQQQILELAQQHNDLRNEFRRGPPMGLIQLSAISSVADGRTRKRTFTRMIPLPNFLNDKLPTAISSVNDASRNRIKVTITIPQQRLVDDGTGGFQIEDRKVVVFIKNDRQTKPQIVMKFTLVRVNSTVHARVGRDGEDDTDTSNDDGDSESDNDSYKESNSGRQITPSDSSQRQNTQESSDVTRDDLSSIVSENNDFPSTTDGLPMGQYDSKAVTTTQRSVNRSNADNGNNANAAVDVLEGHSNAVVLSQPRIDPQTYLAPAIPGLSITKSGYRPVQMKYNTPINSAVNDAANQQLDNNHTGQSPRQVDESYEQHPQTIFHRYSNVAGADSEFDGPEGSDYPYESGEDDFYMRQSYQVYSPQLMPKMSVSGNRKRVRESDGIEDGQVSNKRARTGISPYATMLDEYDSHIIDPALTSADNAAAQTCPTKTHTTADVSTGLGFLASIMEDLQNGDN